MQTLSSRTTRFHSHATHGSRLGGSRLGGPRIAAGSRLGDLLAGVAFTAAIIFAAAIIFGFVG